MDTWGGTWAQAWGESWSISLSPTITIPTTALVYMPETKNRPSNRKKDIEAVTSILASMY